MAYGLTGRQYLMATIQRLLIGLLVSLVFNIVFWRIARPNEVLIGVWFIVNSIIGLWLAGFFDKEN